MEIEWTRAEYRFLRNIAQEVDVLVDRCYRSDEFAAMFLHQHEGDLRKRIATLTEFMHQAGREGRNERVLISKLVMRMRKLLLDLQKQVFPGSSQSTAPPEKAMPVDGGERVSVAEFVENKETALSRSRRDGHQTPKMEIHERLFRSRTKSMIISETMQAKLGENSPEAQERLKRTFHTTLRNGTSPDQSRSSPQGTSSRLAKEWRSGRAGASPAQDVSPRGGDPHPKRYTKKKKTPTGPKAPPRALYHWEEGYTEQQEQDLAQERMDREEKYFHPQNHAKALRKIAKDPTFKTKHHNIGFGRKLAPKGTVRFDPKSSLYTSQYGSHERKRSKKHGTMEILMDFQIRLTKEEYETYKMLALSVPVERSTLHRQAVQEAAVQATRRLSNAGLPTDIDELAAVSAPGSTAVLV